MSPQVRLASARAFHRTAITLLMAVIVGIGSTVAGLVVSAVGLVLSARRISRIVAVHRADRAVARRRDEMKVVWDARWESWGGRLPAKGGVA